MMLSSDEIVPLTSRVAYENRWLRLREDRVQRADGSVGLYGVVERTDFVVVVAMAEGCITLVEQYRYPVRRRLWELPMGMLEDRPETPAAVMAATELREETGLVAENMEKVGELLQAPGFCNQLGHVFLATGLRQGPPDREPSEFGMVSRAVPMAEVVAMIRQGVLVDGMTLAALALLRVHGLL